MTAIGFMLVVLGYVTVEAVGHRPAYGLPEKVQMAGAICLFAGLILLCAVLAGWLWRTFP